MHFFMNIKRFFLLCSLFVIILSFSALAEPSDITVNGWYPVESVGEGSSYVNLLCQDSSGSYYVICIVCSSSNMRYDSFNFNYYIHSHSCVITPQAFGSGTAEPPDVTYWSAMVYYPWGANILQSPTSNRSAVTFNISYATIKGFTVGGSNFTSSNDLSSITPFIVNYSNLDKLQGYLYQLLLDSYSQTEYLRLINVNESYIKNNTSVIQDFFTRFAAFYSDFLNILDPNGVNLVNSINNALYSSSSGESLLYHSNVHLSYIEEYLSELLDGHNEKQNEIDNQMNNGGVSGRTGSVSGGSGDALNSVTGFFDGTGVDASDAFDVYNNSDSMSFWSLDTYNNLDTVGNNSYGPLSTDDDIQVVDYLHDYYSRWEDDD